jgi:hypothetical protein
MGECRLKRRVMPFGFLDQLSNTHTETKWLQQLAGKDSGANSAGSKSAAAAAAGE